MQTLVWLTIALPLAGAVILLLGGKATNAWGHLLGCAAVIGAFACGAVLFTHLLGLPGDEQVEVGDEPAPAGIGLHVTDRVDVDERSDPGDEQHEAH